MDGKGRALRVIATRFFEHIHQGNLQRGFFAQGLARVLGLDEDLAFAGGLLADCCLPVLAANDPSFYLGFRKHAGSLKGTLEQYERQRVGSDHAKMAAMLCLGWQFPDDLVCCILLHHASMQDLALHGVHGTAAVPVRLAAHLPDWFQQDPHGLERLVAFASKTDMIDLRALAAGADQSAEGLCSGLTMRLEEAITNLEVEQGVPA